MSIAVYRHSLPRLLSSMGFGAARYALSGGLREIYTRRPPALGPRPKVQFRPQHSHSHIHHSHTMHTFTKAIPTLIQALIFPALKISSRYTISPSLYYHIVRSIQ